MKTSLRLQIFVFTLTRIVINTLFRMVYPFLPVIGRGLGIGLPQLGRALSARSLVGFFAPLLAHIADSRSRKTGMILGVGLYSLGVFVVVIWPTYWGFVITLLLGTTGKMAFDPAMQAYLGDRVAYEQRGKVLAITELGWSGAFFIGVPLAGFVIARNGWLAPFPLLGILGLVSVIILYYLVPHEEVVHVTARGVSEKIKMILTSRAAIAGFGFVFFLSVANEIVNLVFGVWLEDSFGLQVAALGAASLVIGLAEVGGEGLVSVLVDRLGKKKAVALGLLGNSLMSILLPWMGGTVVGAFTALFLFYLSFEFTYVSSIPLMTEVLPNARATFMSWILASALIGRGLADLVSPAIYQSGFTFSAWAAGGINLLGLAALYWVTLEGEGD